jgi:hypothetical protein
VVADDRERSSGEPDVEGNVVDPDRDAILKRRNRFVALALSGLSSATAAGCYESHTPPGLVPDAGIVDAGHTTPPEPCLGAPLPEDGGEPMPCLRVATDAGEPMPCLDVIIEDGGPDGAVTPGPCLSAPAPIDAGDE